LSALWWGGVGLAAAGAVLPVFLAAPLVAGALQPDTHPRDERQFLVWAPQGLHENVQEFQDEPSRVSRHWVARHRALVLQEGDLACAWLARQPDAPDVDPSGRSDADALLERYVRAEDVAPSPRVSADQHEEFARLSWMTLCTDTAGRKTSPRREDD